MLGNSLVKKFHSCEFSSFMWSQPYKTIIIAFSSLREKNKKKEKALATDCLARFIEGETNEVFFKNTQSSTKIGLHITGCSY